MMKTKCLFCLILTVLISYNCNQPVIGEFSPDHVKGNEAINRITNAGIAMDTIYYASTKTAGSTLTLIGLLNSVLLPMLSKLDENKYYTKKSVDDCISKIYTLGLIKDAWMTVGFNCKIREVPLWGLSL